MENKRGKKKEKIALILLLLVLCCGVVTGVVLFNPKNNNQVSNEDTDTKKPVDKTEVSKVSSNQYTVIVKSDTGVVLPNVLVSICDAEGNMITEPEATDAVGRLLYTPEEKGTYGACVLAAPYQYALDRQIYYFETGEKILNIVLKEDPTAYVAKIGDMNYTLRDAITAANASTEDVTIKLLHDVYVVSDLYFNNKSGKTITLDGGGKTVTYLANASMFPISQKAGTVQFKNLKLVHNGPGAVFRTSNAINLNLTDITILAQNDTEGFYKWSLINLFGKGKTNLTMTRVKIDMDITTIEKDATAASVIRTGNEGTVKDITITMNDCDIDATGAIGRAGIRITPDTTANVVFNNTKFLTQNNYVVAVDGQLKWSQTNSTLGSADEYYNAHPIPDVVATVAGTEYYSLNAAVKKASELGGKEPVKIVGDVALPSSTTFSGNGMTAIIDGNGHTLTTEGGNTIFKINGNNYKLTFRNMTINHGGYERLLQYEANKENIDVTWENVKVVASGTSKDACYRYGLINLRGSGSFTMKSSSVTLDVPKIINGAAPGVIRTGNANDGQKLTICLDNSKIDVSATSGAYGIYVQKGVTADLVLKKYEIHTNNRYPIYVHADDGDATLTYDDMNTWSSKGSDIGWLCNLVSMLNIGDAAQIGNQKYVTLSEAFDAAQAAGGEVTITLLRDCILTTRTDFKTEHSSITIDGDGKYSLSTKGSALIFVLDNDNVALTFKDLVIDHKGYDRFITFNKKSEGVYTGVNVEFNNVQMIASGTTASKCYPYGIFNLRASGAVTMIGSTITLDVEKVSGGNGYGVIRLGNAKDGQNVEITMNNSTIDASKTKDIAGIYVQEGATARVETSNSTIKTNNKYAINVNSKGTLILPQTDTQWSSVDNTIKSITNCAAKVDNVCYLEFYNTSTGVCAWNAAIAKEDATTITLLNDCTVTNGLAVITKAGANITIDGQRKMNEPNTGYKLTTNLGALEKNVFSINLKNNGEKVNLNIQNITIDHNALRALVATEDNGTKVARPQVNVNNATINVLRQDFGVFNFRDNATLFMKDVTVNDKATGTKSGRGIIRVGNSNADGATVYARLQNCTLDTTQISAETGKLNVSIARVNNTNTLNISCQGCTLQTPNDVNVFYAESNGTLIAKVDAFTKGNTKGSGMSDLTPEQNLSSDSAGASINGFLYADLKTALTDAQKMDGCVTVKMLDNATWSDRYYIDQQYAAVTVDGQKVDGTNFKVTSSISTDTAPFEISANDVQFTLKGVDIDHTGGRGPLTVSKGKTRVSVNMHDMEIDYTSSKNNYGVINLRGTVDLYMKGVKITYTNTNSSDGRDYSIIRTGNNDDGARTINATLERCEFNQNTDTKGPIFGVQTGTTMTITAKACTFTTKSSNLVSRTTSSTLIFNWCSGTTWTNSGTAKDWVNTVEVADGYTCTKND